MASQTVLSGLFFTLGIYVYNTYFSNLPAKVYVQRILPLSSVASLFVCVLFVDGLRECSIEIKAVVAFSVNGVVSFLQGMTLMPFLTMIAAICTMKTAGTVYATATSIQNLGQLVGAMLYAHLQAEYGITKTRFEYMQTIVMLCCAMQLVVAAMVQWTLPTDTDALRTGVLERLKAKGVAAG